MQLIVDSGSTKAEWCLIDNKEIIVQTTTKGINPFFHHSAEIAEIIKSELPLNFFVSKIDNIYYYGAGCNSELTRKIISEGLQPLNIRVFHLYSDLLAVAHALLKNSSGIACILGTGSNSGFFDGKEIVKNIPPLGYILGDEGSGAVLGKRFLADCLKELAPTDLSKKFLEHYHLNTEKALHQVYREPYPNRFLASFSNFIIQHIEHPYFYNLVYQNFKDFFVRNIYKYEYKKYPLVIVGSIGYHYRKIVEEVAKEEGIVIQEIAQTPMEGLIQYYTSN